MNSRERTDDTSGTGGTGGAIPSARWPQFVAAQPELARRVRERFGAYRHHVLATLRKDGSPRLSGLEADFRHGELWLGMMANSLKSRDLRRDPRFALHANPGGDSDMADAGDVCLDGRAVEITDPALIARYTAEAHPPEPFHLFRAHLTAATRTYIQDPHIVLESWHPGGPLRTFRRGNDDAPPQVSPA